MSTTERREMADTVDPAISDPAGRYDELVVRLGCDLANRELLDEAMSHRSWCAEHPGNASNERLEFLGDAVLGFVAADLAFGRYPTMSEGELTGIRKGVVNATALSEVAAELGLGHFLKLGKGEAAAGGSEKPSILADAMEAVIGAIYLDRGTEVAYEFVERVLSDRIDSIANRLHELDFKSTLQEVLASRGRPAPVYVLTESGPDHDKRFVARVNIGGETLGRGEGRSKRLAEQAAAAEATHALQLPDAGA
jgi:ribonuclease-3